MTAAEPSNRGEDIRGIVNELIERRASGDGPSDKSLLAARPDLLPELAEQLRYLRMVEIAEQNAGDVNDTATGLLGGGHSIDTRPGTDSSVESLHRSELDMDPATLRGQIDRYRIHTVLGNGGFGLVYLAHDEQLDRLVAIKVPHAKLVSKPEDAQAYLAEARTVAGLDHPHIVPVFDVGSTEDCPCYIVSKYIEGTDLAKKIKVDRPSYQDAAELVATIADALHYAHKQGLVHRDIKPANILISNDGQPYLVDFGLALREENIGKGPRFAGTPAYMSPEQARGEGHRVDGRSDIFSLGVVFYQLLVGRQPFRGKTQQELMEQIKANEPRPPRRCDGKISQELDRICQKALCKRAADRYTTARDMADDLRHFLAGQSRSGAGELAIPAEPAIFAGAASSVGPGEGSTVPTGTDSYAGQQTIKVVPKGLRSFDEHDADFFLDLLPGACDRNGLPDSLRFWKSRIEETDPDDTFSVGLMYGPTGCGKSSFVKAGLLPRLSRDVICVFVEATPDDTETQLLQGIRKHCPQFVDNLNLQETLAEMRRGQGIPVGRKMLIVLDQFEQWLHTREDENVGLVQALRQCDGGRLQCVVMVRDDFWMAATRFMRDLEIRLFEGENSAAVDLFPVRHAEKVLAAFGRALGALPSEPSAIDKDHQSFITASIAGLAEEGKVVSAHLALFAEMVKGKAWTPKTLVKVGGTKGIGVTYLEETFSARTAPPERRYHQQAARSVLAALLPAAGTNIKGQMRSYEELLAASGYTNRAEEFGDLIRILDSELRLITPCQDEELEGGGWRVEGERLNEEENVGSTHQPSDHTSSNICPTTHHPPPATRSQPATHLPPTSHFFQLTHDYLVPSLRDWLTRKQKETWRGRAELRLADRSAIWISKPQNRHLPSWWENLHIRFGTDRRKWTLPQQKMMAKAGKQHSIRSGLIAAMLIAMAMAGASFRKSQMLHAAELAKISNRTRAEGLVASLLDAEITNLPDIIAELEGLRVWADPLLQAEIARAADDPATKLRTSLALLPVDEKQIDYLSEHQLPVCTLNQFGVVRSELAPYQDQISAALWRIAQEENRSPAQRFQATAALAEYEPENERWNLVSPFVADYLTNLDLSDDVSRWWKLFEPARPQLVEPLTTIHAYRDHPEKSREVAATALADCLQDQPDQLVNVILVADQLAEFAPLIEVLRPHAAAVKQDLIAEMLAPMPGGPYTAAFGGGWPVPEPKGRDAHWRRQSMAAVTLIHLNFGDEVWPLLRFTRDPSLRSLVIYYFAELEVDYQLLADQLTQEDDVSVRRALIQILGGLQIPESDRGPISQHLRTLFSRDVDPGIHSSVSWTLRQWGETLPDSPARNEAQDARARQVESEAAEWNGRLATYERDELPARQAAWECTLRAQPAEVPDSLSEGLAVHYPFDETEGTVAARGVDGRAAGVYQGPGQPAWVPGIAGGALSLDGGGGHILCESTRIPQRTDPFSFGCWFLEKDAAKLDVLLTNQDSENSRGIRLAGYGGRLQANFIHQYRINGREDGISVLCLDPISVDRWHHVFVTYDGSSSAAGVTIYVDGASIPTTSGIDRLTGSIQSDAPLRIGNVNSKRSFRGRIDDVRIYDRELTGGQVEQLYESGLRAMAQLPSKDRVPAQQEFLTATYRWKDEPLRALIDARWDGVRRWYVNGQGQTMVVFRNPAELHDSQIQHSFAISSHEVTLAEFLRFSEQHTVDTKLVPSNDCPVYLVSFYMAAAYCNWLSQQEGIPEDQWVYQPNSDGRYAAGMKVKLNIAELSGYRLPIEGEWERACRAGTTTNFAFGEPMQVMHRYCRHMLSRAHPVESLLPNDSGLFDMHGNVSEWTQETVIGPQSSVEDKVGRGRRGGSILTPPGAIRSHILNFVPPSDVSDIGFRPTRTYHLVRERK